MAKAMTAPNVDSNWQAESDARCMTDYHKLKSDPKRHKAAVAHMKTQMEQMKAAMGGVKKGETE